MIGTSSRVSVRRHSAQQESLDTSLMNIWAAMRIDARRKQPQEQAPGSRLICVNVHPVPPV